MIRAVTAGNLAAGSGPPRVLLLPGIRVQRRVNKGMLRERQFEMVWAAYIGRWSFGVTNRGVYKANRYLPPAVKPRKRTDERSAPESEESAGAAMSLSRR